MKKKVVIVIIAHKAQLTEAEKRSLQQCYKVLGHYPVKLICPQGLDVSVYRSINPVADIEFIDPVWQSSYIMFNELKKDLLLYEKYEEYEYMLFYELDAWVFKDELDYWCKKGYDYIGAPWFEDWARNTNKKISGVGNGGFSLRNIESAKRILKRLNTMRRFRRVWFSSRMQSVISYEKILIRCSKDLRPDAFDHLNITVLSKVFKHHEDYFWASLVPKVFSGYKLADVNSAMKFSFEVNPSHLYSLNDMVLPFGCHAWEKYEPGFWDGHINKNNA